jgi:hypothetical protein
MRFGTRLLLAVVATVSLLGAVESLASAQGVYRQTGCVEWWGNQCMLWQTCELHEATRSWSCWYYGRSDYIPPTESGTY